MVVLRQLPDPGTIRAFKGSIDFYTVRGQVIARAWPRKTKHLPSPAEIDQQNHLKEAMTVYNAIAPRERANFFLGANTGNLTSRDLFMKHYFGTFPAPRSPFPTGYGPADHVPFPDPAGTYWSVIWRTYNKQITGGLRLRFKVSKSGTYVLYTFAGIPTGTMQTYRRRGLNLDAAASWFPHAAAATLVDATDGNNQLSYNFQWVYDAVGEAPFYYFLAKSHQGTGKFCRGFSQVYEADSHNPATTDPLTWYTPGGVLAWPQRLYPRGHNPNIPIGGFDPVHPWPPKWDDRNHLRMIQAL